MHVASLHKVSLLTRFPFSPLDLQPCQAMADPLPLRRLLRICLDSYSLATCLGIQITQLDLTYRGLWTWGTPMGTNMVGNIRVRPFPSMGRELCLRGTGLTKSLAMARRDGCLTGSRLWHDPLADPHPYAYLFHTTCIAGHRFSCDHLCKSICAE